MPSLGFSLPPPPRLPFLSRWRKPSPEAFQKQTTLVSPSGPIEPEFQLRVPPAPPERAGVTGREDYPLDHRPSSSLRSPDLAEMPS